MAVRERVSLDKAVLRGVVAAIGLCIGCPVCASKDDPPSPAQEDYTALGLEQLMQIPVEAVYGASKYLQKVTDAPARVSVVSADEIQKFGYRTVDDILRAITGVYVSYDRAYSVMGVSGFARAGDYNTRVLVLVDGHRINENVYDGAFIGNEFGLDVDLIERVEFIRGSGSSLYGTNAFFCVVNVVSKKPADLAGVEIAAEAGSLDTYRGRVTAAASLPSGFEWLLSGTVYDSAGHRRLYYPEYDTPETNHGVAENLDKDSAYNLMGKAAYGDFSARALYSARRKYIPTASFGIFFNDPRTHALAERDFLELQYERDINDRLALMVQVSYDRFYYEGDYPIDVFGTGEALLSRDGVRARWWGGEVKLTGSPFAGHKFNLGAELRDNLQQDQYTYLVDPYVVFTDARRSSDIWAVYLQDEFAIGKKLLLNAGVRHDRYSDFGGTTHPRLALIYHPREHTTVKLLYGEAFRAANAFELYNDNGVTQIGNPSLESERIRSAEIVLEQYVGEHLRFALSGFANKARNLINQTVNDDGLIVFQNLGQTRSRGSELEVEARLANGMQGRAGYTYQRTTDGDSGASLTNSPRHLLKLNWLVPVVKPKIFAGLGVHYMSSRVTLAGDETDSFWLTNLTLTGAHLLGGLDVCASIYNVLDEKYADPGGEEHLQDQIRQDGRLYRLELTYRFTT